MERFIIRNHIDILIIGIRFHSVQIYLDNFLYKDFFIKDYILYHV